MRVYDASSRCPADRCPVPKHHMDPCSRCSCKYAYVDYALKYSIDDLFRISCDFWLYLFIMACQIFGFNRSKLAYNLLPKSYPRKTTPSYSIWASEDAFHEQPRGEPIFKSSAWDRGSTHVPTIMLGMLIAMLGEDRFAGALTPDTSHAWRARRPDIAL